MEQKSCTLSSAEEDSSVYLLLSRLSEIIVKESCPSLSGKKLQRSVSDVRASVYGTLLGKTHTHDVTALTTKLDHMSPLCWLIAHRSALNNTDRAREASEMGDAIREAFNLGWEDAAHPILRTLICLANTSSLIRSQKVLDLEPFSGIGHKHVSNSRIYPSYSPDAFKPPPWMSLEQSISPFGGYTTSFPFNKKPGENLPLFKIFGGTHSGRNALQGRLYQLQTIPALAGPRELSVPPNMLQSNFEDEGYFTPMTEMAAQNPIASKCTFEDPTKIWSEAIHIPTPKLKSWETLGNLVTQPEAPFLSAAGPKALHHISTLLYLYEDIFNTHYVFDPIPTSREEFARDIFLLLQGIASINFPYVKEKDCFEVRSGMWLENYCVKDTAALCGDALFCGTHFRRLNKLSNSSNSPDESGLIRCLKDWIKRWTQFYCGSILILSLHFKSHGNSILVYDLLKYIHPLKQQVECLSGLCCTYSFLGENNQLPSGAALLAHVYEEACKPNSQQSTLLYSVLKSCFEVYLKCLQRWIFWGDCSDEEFFVHVDPSHATKRDRSFWNQGFVLDKHKVPVFLQGLEVPIFDCGKAMKLLELCSPQHPLCLLLKKRPPTLHCCLYKSDMEKVQKECAQFEFEAQKVCGNLMNVTKLLEEEKEQAAHLLILVRIAQREREKRRVLMKSLLDKEKAEKKERQNVILKAQILEMQERKAAEKEQERIEDELYLRECERLETAAKLMEEEERKKVIAHYEELGKMICKQNQLREWQVKRLKMSDKRQKFLHEDRITLERECQLLEKASQDDSNLERSKFVATSENKSTSFPSSELTDNSQKYVVSPLETIDSPDQGNRHETQIARNLFKEAAEIKAKVLQVEFGFGSEGSLLIDRNLSDMTSSECSNVTENEEAVNNLHAMGDNSPLRISSLVSVTSEVSSRSGSRMNDTDMTESDKTVNPTDLVRNRQKVLTEDELWKSVDSRDVAKKASKDSGIVLDWEKNRQKVLHGEYNIITGTKQVNESVGSHHEGFKENISKCSELQKNRRRVLGEEYNILTGEKSLANSEPVIIAITKADSGIESLSAKTDDAVSPSSLVSDEKSGSLNKMKDDFLSCRPALLSLSSEISSVSPLTTPHGFVDVPVFTSPFKGTHNLPNGLPLASPLVEFSCDKATYCGVRGIPLMADIADRPLSKSSSVISADNLDSGDKTHSVEKSKTSPNTFWLDPSLQTCLLLPLRVQYQYVSAALLDYFLVELKLLSHLKSLRSFYFMQDGEFGRHLTVRLFSQIYQVSSPDKLFNGHTLDKIVQEALASSQGFTDPNHTRLSLSFKSIPDHFPHSTPNAFDCLQLSYKVKWPLNLLLTPDFLEKYNLIFLFLIRLKRVAWLLQEDFVALKNNARGCFKEQSRDLLNSPQHHQVQMIRHNMSQFVQATLNYVSSCVLHASWSDFESSLKQATTVDHIYNAHVEYIKRLLKRCLLNVNSKRVEAVLSKILICIIKFHGNLRVRPWQVPNKAQGHRTHSVHLEHPNFQQLLSCSAIFKLQVCKLLSYLERLIAPPNQQQHLAEYILLLNINGFYKSSEYLKHAENVQDSDGKSLPSSHSISKERGVPKHYENV